MKILVTGSKGMLASVFTRRFREQGHDCVCADVDTLDIGERDAVMRFASSRRPGLIVNCAAYNLVDKAEARPDEAFRANAAGAENLALAAVETGAFLVHFSSNYIYDGLKAPVPYDEHDVPKPLNQYGASKLEGERRIRKTGARHLIFRLSWLFGSGRNNFIGKVLEWAKGPGAVSVAQDEVSVPTYTEDAAAGVLAAVKAGLEGTWHLPNTGSCSRYGWAEFVLKTLGLKKKMVPGRMSDFNLPARRPGFSVMSNAAIARELGITIPGWKDSVKKFLLENGGKA
jgi:dTDP-4-dehydrorhamnose reductase